MRQSLAIILAAGFVIAASAGAPKDARADDEAAKKHEQDHARKLSPLKPTVPPPHAAETHPGKPAASAAKPQPRQTQEVRRQEIERERLRAIERERLRAAEIARQRALAAQQGLALPAALPAAAAGAAAVNPNAAGAATPAPDGTAIAGAPGAALPAAQATAIAPQPDQAGGTPLNAAGASSQIAVPGQVPGIAAAAPGTPAAPVATAPAPAPVTPSCLPEIAKAEKRYAIPEGLLVAVALAESGRRDPDTGILAPWPWTIDAHGQGAYFDSIDEAASAAGAMLAQNDALVDVGCMQVDLYHHPHAFQTLLAAFDPETNVDYAAQYLVALKQQAGSWGGAVSAYHTGDAHTGGEYVAHVLYYWKDLGTTAATAQTSADRPGLRGFVIDASPAPLEVAANFIERKDYSSATVIYRAILESTPDDQMALFGLAQTMRAGGHADEARQQLERLLTENPGNRAALVTLLAIIDDLPPPQRMTALLSARQVVPASAQIPARLAMLEENRGNRGQAVAEMATAIRLDPSDPILLLDYALMLDRGGYRPQAAAAYEQFLESYQPGSVALTVSLDQIRKRLSYLRSAPP